MLSPTKLYAKGAAIDQHMRTVQRDEQGPEAERNDNTDELSVITSKEDVNGLGVGAVSDSIKKETLDTFTCFPELPIELRLKVWRAAGNLPGLVIPMQIIAANMSGDYGTEHEDHGLFHCRGSKTTQPAILQVCREVRKECLPSFQLIGGPIYRERGKPAVTEKAMLYMNPACNTLYVSFQFSAEKHIMSDQQRLTLPKIDDKDSISSLQSLAIDQDDFLHRCLEWETLYTFLNTHRQVRELLLVVNGGLRDSVNGKHFELVDAASGSLEGEHAKEAVRWLSRGLQILKQDIDMAVVQKHLAKSPETRAFEGEVETKDEETMRKYMEELGLYKSPTVKLVDLCVDGVRLPEEHNFRGLG